MALGKPWEKLWGVAVSKWNIEEMITHEFTIDNINEAIRKASDANNALNVTIKF